MLKQFTEFAQKENLTILELAMRVAGVRGKTVVRGSPNTITDFMEEWFVEEGADGFNTLLPYLPGALNNLKNEPFHRFVNLFRTLKHYHMPAIRNYIDAYIGDRLSQFNAAIQGRHLVVFTENEFYGTRDFFSGFQTVLVRITGGKIISQNSGFR